MRFQLHPRAWTATAGLILGATLLIAIVVSGYALGRRAGKGNDAEAAPQAIEVGAAPQQIDTSDPDWQIPFLEAWKNAPRFDQVINGIAVGPTVEISGTICGPGTEPRSAKPGDERGTPVEIIPKYVPAGARVLAPWTDSGNFVRCGDRMAVSTLHIALAAVDDVDKRVAAGESWFQVPHGGLVGIAKWQFRQDAQPKLPAQVPASSWFATSIGGLPAAVARPAVDAGLGQGVVAVWNKETAVMTIVDSRNLSLEELIKVAEGVIR